MLPITQQCVWMFHQVTSIVVGRSLWQILLNKILLVLKLVKYTIKKFLNTKDSKAACIFSLASSGC